MDSKIAEDIAEGGGKNDEARRLRFVLETIGKTRWPGDKVPEEYAALVEQAQPQGAGRRRRAGCVPSTPTSRRGATCAASSRWPCCPRAGMPPP